MRIALLFAAIACFGLAASADGVSRKAVSSPKLDRLTAMDRPAVPGHDRGLYRHGATYAVSAGSTPLACETSCGEDAVCQSWSFVESYGSAEARCELKRGGGKSEENLLATSGVSPRMSKVLWGKDAVAAPADTLAGEPAPVLRGK